jgi:hypothetical protein
MRGKEGRRRPQEELRLDPQVPAGERRRRGGGEGRSEEPGGMRKSQREKSLSVLS